MYRKYCTFIATTAAISISACGSDDPQAGGTGSGGAAVGAGGAATGDAGAAGMGGAEAGGAGAGDALDATADGPSSCADSAVGAGGGSEACMTCMNDQCKAAACFGAGWWSGSYSGGACESYFLCGAPCCSDQECLKACVPQASSECQACIQDVMICQALNCTSACLGDGGAADGA